MNITIFLLLFITLQMEIEMSEMKGLAATEGATASEGARAATGDNKPDINKSHHQNAENDEKHTDQPASDNHHHNNNQNNNNNNDGAFPDPQLGLPSIRSKWRQKEKEDRLRVRKRICNTRSTSSDAALSIY